MRPEQMLLRLDERSLRGLARLQRRNGDLRLYVPYTSAEMTSAALQRAVRLAKDLTASVVLFAVHVVPFPLPLDRPDINVGFLEHRLYAMLRKTDMTAGIHITFARDQRLGWEEILPPHSLIVMASRKRWWPTPETKLARLLARAGHSVALLGV